MASSNEQTESRYFETSAADGPILLREGGSLPQIRVAYETWGTLNADKSNVILIFHALSGSQHVSGYNPTDPGDNGLWQPETHDGWWNSLVGPGKGIDTNRAFVICPNYLGGCYGTTGPNSLDPETGKPYGSKFPHVSVSDQAEMAARLLDHLAIPAIQAVVGASVGGLCTLTFANLFPNRVRNVIAIASGFKTTVLNRLILFEQILAIENDPYFNGGDYYDSGRPDLGLALARMISHKTFVHLDAFERRARRDIVQADDVLSWYKVRDQFQSYMLHQGKKFVQRFDANTYLRIIDMWSRYDAVREGNAETPGQLLARSREAGHQYLVFSIDSDFCIYPEEQAELVSHLEAAKVDNLHVTVHSDKGHDSFLLEPELYAPHIHYMLRDS
ncbi:MAG: homoserine O-acetyltransferase [Verrucomicrobia bacterium]|nr:homoserine O-acetyltransferase [Verrucomicrobiota bacterium]MDA1005024.1 homoserine O-acetyltransferase [Verrucomicrobiota bacterium]